MISAQQVTVRRWVARSQSWAMREIPQQLQWRHVRVSNAIGEALLSAPRVEFSEALLFDHVFLLPVGSGCVDLAGILWMRTKATYGKDGERVWTPLEFGRPIPARTQGFTDASVIAQPKFGPLRHGFALVVVGKYREAWENGKVQSDG